MIRTTDFYRVIDHPSQAMFFSSSDIDQLLTSDNEVVEFLAIGVG